MDNSVLCSLTQDPQPPADVALKAQMSEPDALAALQRLTQQYLAIPDDEGFELTGPLSWFGSFGAAVRYFARRNFLVSITGDPEAHLFLCDVRVKDGRPAGDPETTTVGVFACGRTARDFVQASADAAACEECRLQALRYRP